MQTKLVHIYNWWQAEGSTSQRMAAAKRTWIEFYRNDTRGILPAEHVVQADQRSSLDLGEKVVAPFLKDVIAFGLSENPKCELFLYTNSDPSLVKDASTLIRDCLAKWSCGYSHRVDFAEENFPKTSITRTQLKTQLALASWGAGADSFFFTRQWWTDHKDNLPDALIGFEGWDACMMTAMLQSGLPEPIKWISYHQKHQSYWKEHRIDSPGQIYNRKVCTDWAFRNNIGHLVNVGNYLFKLPTPYNVVI